MTLSWRNSNPFAKVNVPAENIVHFYMLLENDGQWVASYDGKKIESEPTLPACIQACEEHWEKMGTAMLPDQNAE